MHQLHTVFITLFWVNLYSKSSVEGSCEPPRVSLTSGCVEGLNRTSALGRTFYSFHGIPYAAPPIGPLRFKAPHPVANWTGVLKTVKEPPACLQPWRENPFPISFSEDCLYLNVFTPYFQHPTGKPMPVIVWIHGGKFYQSSGSTYKYGPDFLLMKDVVLVVINFRLGIFGYLNMNISEAQGNASMKDKIAALRWVKKEISKFGGDPGRVTIAGGSSGAADVSFLYISPIARGLFNAAISQSGSALCHWAFLPSTLDLGLQVAHSLGCPTHMPEVAVSCLRDVQGSVLAEQQMIVSGAEGFDLPFVPSTETYSGEEVFLPDSPQQLIKKSGNVPYIIGINDGEGLMEVNDLQDDPDQLKNIKEKIGSYLPVHMVKNSSAQTLHEITNRIEDFYFGQNSSVVDSKYEFVNYMTDRQFSFCILKTVENLSERAPVYLYYFTFQGEFQPIHSYASHNLTGVCHGDELGYMFYRNYIIKAHNNVSAYPRDMAMVRTIVNLWTNFAMYRNPTPPGDDATDVTWKPATGSVNNHLIIGDVLTMAEYSLLKDRETLWKNLYEILSQATTTGESHYLKYSVISLLVAFSILVVVYYIIQYKKKRSMYFDME